ncbi:hypothetical protein JHK86_037548 [Glycine max]|nr:hypothetical protein JHK86_037548 [Glycine max]
MLMISASGGDTPSRGFDTPTLDLVSTALLHAIFEHGGYTCVSMATLAENGDIRTAEAVCKRAWEQLHSGPWHSVLSVWREAYSMACLLVARHHYHNGEFKDVLRVLDLGIIMGGTLLRKDLDSAIEKISEQTRKSVRVSDLGNSEHRLVDRKLAYIGKENSNHHGLPIKLPEDFLVLKSRF